MGGGGAGGGSDRSTVPTPSCSHDQMTPEFGEAHFDRDAALGWSTIKGTPGKATI